VRSLFLGLDVRFTLHPLRLHATFQAMRAMWVCQLRASWSERWGARVVPFLQEELISLEGWTLRFNIRLRHERRLKQEYPLKEYSFYRILPMPASNPDDGR